MDAPPPRLYAVVGATASGKGSLARALAVRLGAELLSVDSMKVYRGMDIGTAKPTRQERALVPHHLLDLVEPVERFSVAQYLPAASRAEADVRTRGRMPLYVGGTALYLKALRQGIFPEAARDADCRRALEARVDREGATALHRELAAVDPAAAQRIHPADVKRLIRALEVFRTSGEPISGRQTQFAAPGRPVCWIGIRWPRAELVRRIDERVERMLAAGWLEETRRLAEAGAFGTTSREAIGYRELLGHLRGDTTLDEAVRAIKTRTRQLARRQRTWFRSFADIRWLEMDATRRPEGPLEEAIDHFRRTP
ncbi:MAG: tRNA (adenosine(37)-N6)-dimethylallyltransferase MiaA [Planctomycetes bacterium]|nr:tRNA (adenosine(37)-N6)-dimethylallyltransferase MiaA [Planctomycetota bacterium]